MTAKRIVHIIGTGTIGEPLIGLLTDIKKQFGLDEVTFDNWKAIEAAEIERGKRRGAPRLKFNRVGRMLTAAKKKGESPTP